MNRNGTLLIFLLVSLISFQIFAADHYTTLELPNGRGSTDGEIKRAFRRLAKRYHPDKNPGNVQAADKFRDVHAAYETLSDPIRRVTYDHAGIPNMAGASDIKSGGPRQRPTTGLHDPLGTAALNNERINFLHETYVELRNRMSAANALIATLKKERTMDRPRIYLWGAAVAEQIYEAGTQNVFGEFLSEIIDDIFYTGEDIQSPMERELLEIPEDGNPKAVQRRTEVTFSRLPTVDQILQINKLCGDKGQYFLIVRAIKEARSYSDLVQLFYYMMKNYWNDVLDQTGDLPEKLTRARKKTVTQLEPALSRVRPDQNVPQFISEFIESRLSRIFPADRKMVVNLLAILKDIATPEALKALADLSTDTRFNAFVRKKASEVRRSANLTPGQTLIGGTSKQAAHPEAKHESTVIELNEGQIRALREKLATPVGNAHDQVQDWIQRIEKIDAQFEAASQLHAAGNLNDSDIQNIGRMVNEYYWRYRSHGKGGAEKIVRIMMKIAPTYPKVIQYLARAIEEGRGYEPEEIAAFAIKNDIRDPQLLEAFRSSISLAQFTPNHRKTIEALGRLGRADDPQLVDTLRNAAEFRYDGKEPEPESYEAALALGRLGVSDKGTENLLRTLMRENEGQIRGAGVPFAAALALAGIRDDEIEFLLRRELTHSPNGYRDHTLVAQEALRCKEALRAIGASSPRL